MSFLIYPTIKQAPILGMLGLGGGIARARGSAANVWATLSSADADTKDSPNKPTLSNSDLTATASSGGVWNHGRSTLGFTTGKWYWEVTASGNAMIGIEPTSADSVTVPLHPETICLTPSTL